MANPIQQLTLRRELDEAATARRRRQSEVGGGGHDGDAFFVFGCPGPLLLLTDLARLLWMYVTLFGLLTGGGLVSRHMSLIQTFDDRGYV